MIEHLPSFQIEVTEEPSVTGKTLMYRINANTWRICSLINPALERVDHVLIEKPEVTPLAPTANLKSFYTRIALELSSLTEQELLAHFVDLRICNQMSRSQKNYKFMFKHEMQ